MTACAGIGWLIAEVGDLGRDQAREAALRELSRTAYQDAQPSLPMRLLGRLVEALVTLLDRAAGAAPGGTAGLLLLLTLLVIVIAVVLTRIGPVARGRSASPVFAGPTVLTAEQHRDLAKAAAAQGRFADAVRERMRAVVRELEARGVLDPRPGRTAAEVATEAGPLLPAVAGELHRAAQTFDEVWYGGRTADAASYRVVADVDEALSARAMALR